MLNLVKSWGKRLNYIDKKMRIWGLESSSGTTDRTKARQNFRKAYRQQKMWKVRKLLVNFREVMINILFLVFISSVIL